MNFGMQGGSESRKWAAPTVIRVKGLLIAEDPRKLAGVKPAIPTNLP